MQVWRRIQQSLEKHRRAALISVVKVEGSAPREVGARMVIQKDAGFFGTIVDSLLGAVFERRGWLNNDLVNLLSTAAAVAMAWGLGSSFEFVLLLI